MVYIDTSFSPSTFPLYLNISSFFILKVHFMLCWCVSFCVCACVCVHAHAQVKARVSVREKRYSVHMMGREELESDIGKMVGKGFPSHPGRDRLNTASTIVNVTDTDETDLDSPLTKPILALSPLASAGETSGIFGCVCDRGWDVCVIGGGVCVCDRVEMGMSLDEGGEVVWGRKWD